MAREKIIVGLDLSSEPIRAIAGFWEDNNSKIKVMDYSETKASGFEKGLVSDIVAASDCLAKVIKDLRKQTGADIGPVYVGLSGTHFQSFESDVELTVSQQKTRQIGRAEMASLHKACSNIRLPLDRCLVQRILKDYSIDKGSRVKNPLNMACLNLIAHNYLITGSRTAIDNFKKVLVNAGILLGDFVISGIAAGYSLINKSEAESNNLLINIRSNTTEAILYSQDKILSFNIFETGQKHVVEQVARSLKISPDTAQNLTDKYGSVQAKMIDPEERVMVLRDNGTQSMARRDLARIIEPVVRELFFKIKETLERDSSRYAEIEKVIITGECARMEGSAEALEAILEHPVRLGLVRDVMAEAQILNYPEWSTAMGLVIQGFKNNGIAQNKTNGLAASWIVRVRNWIEEYF
ncbi:MAG: cell division protein FtsA [Candidatus Omnitrophica bacterium]|nr:cell division protein FtsA [Candidatus Omnitrophota bacterium]